MMEQGKGKVQAYGAHTVALQNQLENASEDTNVSLKGQVLAQQTSWNFSRNSNRSSKRRMDKTLHRLHWGKAIMTVKNLSDVLQQRNWKSSLNRQRSR